MGNKSKYQKYIVETINRADIKNADYNPRLIDDENKKALKKALKKHGLVEAIVWNRRTGNLVGGHQRLEALDTLEKNQDYSLDVCVVDVDQREEAVLNVQLNNPSLQGDWDLNRLEEMVTDLISALMIWDFQKMILISCLTEMTNIRKCLRQKKQRQQKTQ